MKQIKFPRHLRLVTEADRIFCEGPITRLGLWYRFEPVNYKKVVRVFVTKVLLLRALFYWGFQF